MRPWLFFATLWGLALAGAGCADEAPRPTTPRPGARPESSDDAVGSGAGAASPGASGGAGASTTAGGGGAGGGAGGAGGGAGGGGAGVPAGLDMRVGGEGGTTGTNPVATLPQGGTNPGSPNPRTLPPPWIGGKNAKVVIEEFSNFECPYCQRAAKVVKQLLAHYGTRIKMVYRHLPFAYEAQAKLAAQAAVCAQAQGKFWPMKEMLFEHHDALTRADLIGYARRLGLDVPRFTRDLDGGACLPRVEADVAEAKKRAIEGTPAYFINGTKHEGAKPFEEFKKLIDAALAD